MVTRKRAGFTLVEIMVTTAVGAAVIAAAFTLASTQVRALNDHRQTGEMHANARMVFEAIAEDIRNAGFGTTFYAGVDEDTAFNQRAVVLDAATDPLGVPAIRVVDNVTAPAGGPGLGVRLGSDAIMILRPMGQATNIPASAPGQLSVPPAPGTTPIALANAAALTPCLVANRGSGLVLVSDVLRQGTPASMLFEIDPGPTGLDLVANTVRFVNMGAYGIGTTGARNTGGVSPNGAGPGSLVVCVELVTYWLDNLDRLRVWRSRGVPSTFGISGNAPTDSVLAMNPNADPVLAEGVVNLQIALRMSSMAPTGPNQWVFDADGPQVPDEIHLVETRAVRLSAIVRTLTPDNNRATGLNPNLENAILPAYEPRYHYRVVQFETELRNMRLFDLASDTNRTWNEVRSFQP